MVEELEGVEGVREVMKNFYHQFLLFLHQRTLCIPQTFTLMYRFRYNIQIEYILFPLFCLLTSWSDGNMKNSYWNTIIPNPLFHYQNEK